MTTGAAPDATKTALVEGPYLGLRTFEETDASRYFGREDIVVEVAKMIRRSMLTLLFGVSGTGKSSMIRAGVFPLLRTDQVFPILIRLGFTPGLPDLRVQVRDAIKAQIEQYRIDAPAPKPDEPLPEYFARHPFWTAMNQLVTPLLVFDQFEEIFTISKDRTTQVEALMDELAALIEHAPRPIEPLPDIIAPRPRVMLALREDFLAHLEDYRKKIPSLAGNRYRLTRMNGAQALRAVMAPAGALVTEATAIKIVRFVAGGADSADDTDDDRPLEALEVEPAILSLVCQQLDRVRRSMGAPQITDALIKTQGGQIVEKFYEQAFADLPPEVRALVEDRLVTSDGFRTTMPKAEALETPGVTAAAIQHLLDDKIIREEVRFGSLHIELIHDRLTKIASLGRAKRREEAKEHERERRWWRRALVAFGGVATLLIVVVISAAMYVRAQRRAAERQQHDEELKQENAYRFELSDYLARDARDALAHGDAKLAHDRIDEARDVRDKAKGADLPDQAMLYKRALVGLLGHVQAVEASSEIASVRLWPDGTLVTCGRDGTVRLWKDNRGTDLGSHVQPNVACHADHGGSWVLQVRSNGGGEVRKRAEPDAPLSFDGPPSARTQQSQPPATSASSAQMPLALQDLSLDQARWHECIAPDDSAFAVWADDVPGVRLWTMPEGTRMQSKALDAVQATRVECMPKGRLAVLGRDRVVQLFDSGANVVQSTTYDDEHTQITSIASSGDGSLVAIGSATGGSSGFSVRLLHTDAPKLKDPGESIATPRPDHVDLDRDGTTLLVTSTLADGRTFVGLWDTASRTPKLAFDRPTGRARIEPAQDSDLLVIAADRQAEAWRISDGSLVGRAAVDVDLATSRVSFEAIGSRVYVAAATRTSAVVRVLDDPTEKWADRTLVPAVGNPQSWAMDGNAKWDQRARAGVVDVTAWPTQVVARTAGGSAPPLTGFFIDARVSPIDPRIAVLAADGTVAVYTERLADPVRLETTGVRAIRWAADGELITIAADKVMLWKDGAVADQLPAVADDATLVTAPARILWTCAVKACTAWDVASKRPRQRIAVDSLVSPRIQNADGAVLASVDGWATAFLLPPQPASTPRAIGKLDTLAAFDGDLLGRDALGSVVFTGGDVLPLGSGPAAPSDTGQIFAADGRRLAFGPASDLAGQGGITVWASRAAALLLRVRGGVVGVVEQTLALVAFDATKPPKSERDDADWSPGTQAAYSPAGDQVAVITPGDDIAVRSSDGTLAIYRHVAERPWLVRLPNSRSKVVAALSPSELLVWTRVDAAPIVKRGVFRDLAIDATGTHLVALGGDGQAQIYDVNDSGVPMPALAIPAVAIAIDDKGDLVAADEGTGTVRIYMQGDDGWSKVRAHDVGASQRPYELVFAPRGGKFLWIEDRHDGSHSRIVETREKGSLTVNPPRECVFSASGAFAACVYPLGGEAAIHVLELARGEAKDRFAYSLPRLPEATFACVGADGKFIVGMSIRRYGQLLAWNPRLTGAPVVRMSATDMVGCRYDGPRASAGDTVTTLTDTGYQQTRPLGGDVVAEETGPPVPLDSVLTERGELRLAVKLPGKGVAVRDSTGGTTFIPSTRDVELGVFLGEELVVAREHAWRLDTFGPPYAAVRRTLAPEKIASREPPVSVLVSPAPGVLAAGFVDGSVELWADGADKPAAVFRGFGPAARRIAINARGWVAVADDDGYVAVWQKEPGSPEKLDPLLRIRARGATPGAPTIAFVDGDRPALVTANADGEVKWWTLGGELPTPNEIEKLVHTANAETSPAAN